MLSADDIAYVNADKAYHNAEVENVKRCLRRHFRSSTAFSRDNDVPSLVMSAAVQHAPAGLAAALRYSVCERLANLWCFSQPVYRSTGMCEGTIAQVIVLTCTQAYPEEPGHY
jgi:hypothetical protein